MEFTPEHEALTDLEAMLNEAHRLGLMVAAGGHLLIQLGNLTPAQQDRMARTKLRTLLLKLADELGPRQETHREETHMHVVDKLIQKSRKEASHARATAWAWEEVERIAEEVKKGYCSIETARESLSEQFDLAREQGFEGAQIAFGHGLYELGKDAAHLPFKKSEHPTH